MYTMLQWQFAEYKWQKCSIQPDALFRVFLLDIPVVKMNERESGVLVSSG
jgi:hypothetical protein